MNILDIVSEYEQSAFTGREAELDLFRALLPLDRKANLASLSQETRERIRSLLPLERVPSIYVLNVFGIGGIGKSQLLGQFSSIANEYENATGNVALVANLDLQVQKGIFEFLNTIHDQLSQWDLDFPNFEEGLKHRQSIEDKLVGRSDIPKDVLQMFARGAHAALKIGASFVPGGSIVTDVIGPEHVEAAISAIYGVVGRKEGDFWMKPEEELTDRLVEDLKPISDDYRLVLIMDTYEFIGTFDDWVRERLFGRLGKYAMLVLGGRHHLEGKGWQKFAPVTFQRELQPFSQEEVKDYLQRKGIESEQMGHLAQDMAEYTDGHPLTLSMLAELAVQSGVDLANLDLTRSPERLKIIHELLDRITQNVAADLRNALKICAILRVVTVDSLAYMLDEKDLDRAGQLYDELRRVDFVKERGGGGIALHDVIWATYNEELCKQSPVRFRELNDKAAQFFKDRLGFPSTGSKDAGEREYIFHSLRTDESRGTKLFCELAENLVRHKLVADLSVLVNDVDTYQNTFEQEDSRLWLKYYKARLLQFKQRLHDAEIEYMAIANNEQAERKLRGYAFAEWGSIRGGFPYIAQEGGLERLVEIVEQSNKMLPSNDRKRLANLLSLAKAHSRVSKTVDKALAYFEEAKSLARQYGDYYSVAGTLLESLKEYAIFGDWKRMLDAQAGALEALGEGHEASEVYADVLGAWAVAWAWAGKYSEAERKARAAWAVRMHRQDEEFTGLHRDLGFALGMQGKFSEANELFLAGQQIHKEIFGREDDTSFGFQGAILARQGDFAQARQLLNRSWELKHEPTDKPAFLELSNWLGQLNEIGGEQTQAEAEYDRGLKYRHFNRNYFECGILTGLSRAKLLQSDFGQLETLLGQAEQLAQRYEYNDHLASLRLTQAHAAWEGQVPEWGSGFDVALSYYKQALIYSLRYNRFLLDEALSGRPQGTPLQSIIPHCLEKGDEGRRMLLALKEWWQLGANDMGTPRPDTISPIAEGIPLLEAERIARERERGDTSPQRSLIEQITSSLA